MGFFRQEYWSGLPFPSPEYLPDPGIEPRSPTLQVDALTSEPPGSPRHFQTLTYSHNIPILKEIASPKILFLKCLVYSGHQFSLQHYHCGICVYTSCVYMMVLGYGNQKGRNLH